LKKYSYIIIIFFFSCTNKKVKTLFEEQPSSQTNIHFVNKIEDTDSLNILDYLYYYNGAGVATGDINNDGLVDIYFNSNQHGNKLYLNKGNFVFEDITDKADVKGTADWTTGVVMVDVNADGWLDIYISTVTNHQPQSGSSTGKVFFSNGENQLLINNKNGTFTNKAKEYGLNLKGYNTQAVFFDYDRDGDVDLFQLQHSIHQTDTYGDTSLRKKYSEVSGCKLYRNDNTIFTNVTKESNLYSSALGYGLGVAVADYNHDGWQDIYVGNDFHESDYYYINNQNGTFSETNATAFNHQSNFSMGNDAADLNNDGWTDIISLDMLPKDEKILKSSSGDETLDNYENQRQLGYSYQYSRNCLQLNTGRGKQFSEIGLYSGIAATDWSWAVLANDFNLDGQKDLFISNGIKQRMNDLDYVKFISSDSIKTNAQGTRIYDKEMLKRQPNGAWHNYAFSGNASLRFADVSTDWGFTKTNLSNGIAYADLDNDGDADLITNNINTEAGIFKNTTNDKKTTKWISISLKNNNVDAIGAKCFVYNKGQLQYQELQPVRGFLSSVEPKLFFGFADTTVQKIDSILIIWDNKEYQKLIDVTVNKNTVIKKEATIAIKEYANFISTLLTDNKDTNLVNITSSTNIKWQHKENLGFVDFNRQWLIPHEYSTKGPAVAVSDINKDGLEDVFFGGAKGQPSILYVQTATGSFTSISNTAIAADSLCEDVAAVFLDADMDGDSDLYVASGGSEYFDTMPALKDRLYINDGKGIFSKSTTLPNLYENKSCVTVADIDVDGDMDIFVGGQIDSKQYGNVPKSFLLINDGNANFTIATTTWNIQLEKIGMVSDAKFADINADNLPDLIVCGEWMRPTIFINQKNKFTIQQNNFPTGWYQHLNVVDIDMDGYKDIFLGNYGLNSKLNASSQYPLQLYITDVDNNGIKDQILSVEKDGNYYPFSSKEYLEKQLPYLKKEYLSYTNMAGHTTDEIFKKKLKGATIFSADTLGSYWLKNEKGKAFSIQPVNKEMQWSPIMDSYYNNSNLITTGNFYGVNPYEGRYDASAVTAQYFKNGRFQNIPFSTTGEGRKIIPIKIGKNACIIIAKNNASPSILELH
jgi:enediyne biosynthesis protein E4